MKRDELRTAVLDALGNIAPDADLACLAPDRDLREQLDIDSMDFLNFMIAIHEVTGIEVPERDYGKLATLDAVLDYLLSKANRSEP